MPQGNPETRRDKSPGGRTIPSPLLKALPPDPSDAGLSSEPFERRIPAAAPSLQPDAPGEQGSGALEREARLPLTGWQREVEQAQRFGLAAAE
ncbi:MAG: hypothetical protein ACKOZT_13345, partial [Cyanobium sp.]